MNIPINIIVTIISFWIFIGINVFWISHINMLYLLPYLILPPISKKLFGDIGLQCWSEIIETIAKNGVVFDATSNEQPIKMTNPVGLKTSLLYL